MTIGHRPQSRRATALRYTALAMAAIAPFVAGAASAATVVYGAMSTIAFQVKDVELSTGTYSVIFNGSGTSYVPGTADDLASAATQIVQALNNSTAYDVAQYGQGYDYFSLLTASGGDSSFASTNQVGTWQGTATRTGGPIATFTLTSAASPAPEPATWAMMILGFGLVGYSLRRRQAHIAFGGLPTAD